jgi:uncharacterized protein
MCARKQNTNVCAGEKKIRTCINCGEKLTKGGLYRVVRTPQNGCVFDASGRASGRGAYVCSLSCLEQAQSKGKLARALKVSINPEAYEEIHAAMQTYISQQKTEKEE